jgi:peptidyl-prolyl cis-trans isomerase A (cyclophilin A)
MLSASICLVLATLQAAPQAPKKTAAPAPVTRPPGLYATIATSMGNVVCELFEKQAPLTVANFTGLARGTKEWTDPKTRQKVKRPLYPGTPFHRVIPGFMIQGGDPLGNGTGDPGYSFQDEFSPDLRFDQPGRLAMANAGPGTNGSQFFITEVNTPFLNNKHTIFGQVVEGMDVVTKIINVPRDPNDKPRTPVVIQTIRIQRFPAEPAKAPATKSTTTKSPATKAPPATKTPPKKS